jgi:hypothetical protein
VRWRIGKEARVCRRLVRKNRAPEVGHDGTHIRAVECLESWIHEETIHTSSSQVGVTEKMLGELMKHMEEMEAGWDDVGNI